MHIHLINKSNLDLIEINNVLKSDCKKKKIHKIYGKKLAAVVARILQ